MKRLLIVVVFAIACTDQPSPTGPARIDLHTPRFTVVVTGATELPALSTNQVIVSAINDRGQAVGLAADVDLKRLPVLWEPGTIQVIGSLGAPVAEGMAADVNDLGQVVGHALSSPFRPFLWTPGGAMQDLGTIGGPVGVAQAINNVGQVVGFAEDANGDPHAFLWQNGNMQDLGTLPGGSASSAEDVNNLGEVVGFSTIADGSLHAFIVRNGVMQDLGVLPNQPKSIAQAINDFGEVVGQSGPISTTDRAFHWKNGVMRDLGTLGGDFAEARDINDLGQIVGLSETSGGHLYAFLSMDGVMYNLGAPFGAASNAFSINNLGQVLGVSANAQAELRAFIWSVPIRPPVDLIPGDVTNTARLRKPGTMAVAILGNRYFDATTVDPATVTLGDEVNADTPVSRKKKGGLDASFVDVDRDGDTDLLLQFDVKEMVTNADLGAGITKLTLYGRRTDGRFIRAVKPVTFIP